MKCHIGVDRVKLHTVRGTSGAVNVVEANNLLRDSDRDV